MDTTTTLIPNNSFSSKSNKYPTEFILIQVILGIILLFVLIALIFIIWYRFIKKKNNDNITPVQRFNTNENINNNLDHLSNNTNTHVYDFIEPHNVTRVPNVIYSSSNINETSI